jgi:hypothetical protein
MCLKYKSSVTKVSGLKVVNETKYASGPVIKV